MSLKVEKKDAAKAHSGANKTQSRRYPLAPLSKQVLRLSSFPGKRAPRKGFGKWTGAANAAPVHFLRRG